MAAHLADVQSFPVQLESLPMYDDRDFYQTNESYVDATSYCCMCAQGNLYDTPESAKD
jgi:hypothetical protein